MKKWLIYLSFALVSCSLLYAEPEPVKPDHNGIYTLSVTNGDLGELGLKKYFGKELITKRWNKGSYRGIWNFELPQSGLYIFEINYAAALPSSKILVELNGKKWFDWKIMITWKWSDMQNMRPKKGSIKSGKNRLVLSVPNVKSDCFELYCIRLIPASLEQRIAQLKKQPYLGMSVDEMELILGKGLPEDYNVEEKGGPTDIDADIYKGLNTLKKVLIWRPANDYFIKGAFIDDKCIALKVGGKKMAVTEAIKRTQTFLPKVQFSTKGYKKGQEFTAYSPDDEKRYKFQYWENSFDLKDSGAVRELNK